MNFERRKCFSFREKVFKSAEGVVYVTKTNKLGEEV